MVNLNSLNREHQAIVDTFVQGDDRTATELLRSHVENAPTPKAEDIKVEKILPRQHQGRHCNLWKNF